MTTAAVKFSKVLDLPWILVIRVATAGWMASLVKAGYVFRKEEMACRRSASLASTGPEKTSPKIKKGENYDFFCMHKLSSSLLPGTSRFSGAAQVPCSS